MLSVHMLNAKTSADILTSCLDWDCRCSVRHEPVHTPNSEWELPLSLSLKILFRFKSHRGLGRVRFLDLPSTLNYSVLLFSVGRGSWLSFPAEWFLDWICSIVGIPCNLESAVGRSLCYSTLGNFHSSLLSRTLWLCEMPWCLHPALWSRKDSKRFVPDPCTACEVGLAGNLGSKAPWKGHKT